MIANIKGILIQKSVSSVVVDVHGVGYRVSVPLSTFYELPDIGLPVSLKIHTHVKEDAIQLFGFRTEEEKDVFQLMISVAGIGPRLATNILSGISAPELARAVCAEDLKKLVSIPGIGKKMADRMIFELKEKLQKILLIEEKPLPGAGEDPGERIKEDALSALVNLGYKSSVAKDTVEKVIEASDGNVNLEMLLKKALKTLAK
jgi:Holliday junction DNA helicase RuvA